MCNFGGNNCGGNLCWIILLIILFCGCGQSDNSCCERDRCC